MDSVRSTNGCHSGDIEPTDNSNEDSMYSAVDKFISAREQSYEDFVNGFVYLTKDDVPVSDNCYRPRWETTESSSGTTQVEHSAPLQTDKARSQDEVEDDLEAEVLEVGCVQSVMSNTTGSIGTSRVIFDNFVDVEEEQTGTREHIDQEINDLLGDTGYTASFGGSGSREATVAQSTSKGLEDPCSELGTCETDITVQAEANFGGAEPETGDSHRKVAENQTFLDITTSRLCPHTEEKEVSNTDEVVTDTVETFQLDPNFDYDNVKLTPKFSDEDIQIIMSSMKIDHATITDH